MSAIVPNIKVELQENKIINNPGMASKIAVIGAFDTRETNPVLCTSIADAYTQLGDDKTFNGCKVIDKLFYGATSLLAVNITTWSEDTPTKTLTTSNLAEALAKIKGEDFDLLYVAENITDEALAIINSFVEASFELKTPVGYVIGATRSDKAGYLTTAGLVNDFCYGIITQSFTVNETEYDIIESGAYYCGVLAALSVGNSMTMKVVPNVTGVTPELTFETGDDGKALLEAGITTIKCQDRANSRYIVVNSEAPNGYDLYINRARDYVVKQFNLTQFLGERNRDSTLHEIEQELDRVKMMCVDQLDLLEDISFTVEKKTANCVDIYIDSLVFTGIITEIDVYVRVEVE